MKENKIICIVQARMSSKRLPGKILKEINGKTCIERVLERISKSKNIDEIWVATSLDKNDNELFNFLKNTKFNIYRGSLNDVFSRYIEIAKKVSPKYIVRITGDCPLIDPCIIDNVIKRGLDTKADYVSNTIERTYPDGLDVEFFKTESLLKAELYSNNPVMREHVTPYLSGNLSKIYGSGNFLRNNVTNNKNYSHYRWTLDVPEDLRLLNLIYQELDDFCSWKQVINLLEKNPELHNINKHIQHNEGTKISIQKYNQSLK